MQGTTPIVRLFVLFAAAAVLLAPLFISGVEGAVSRTFSEACTVWNARARYQSQPTPQWTTDSLDCASEQPGGLQELVPENVLAQFNLYRTLAGLPNVTLDSTKSADAQAAAWWDAALFQTGWCDPYNLEQCWANTSAPCYSEGRQALATNIRLHQVRWGGTYFDVASILEGGHYDVVLNPETTSIGIGMHGNETGVYQNATGFSCQTIDAAGSPSAPHRRSDASPWYAYPPDGVLEVSAMSGLGNWQFITQAALAETTTVEVFDLLNNFSLVPVESAGSPVNSNGWYWFQFFCSLINELTNFVGTSDISSSWVVAGAQFEVQIRSDNDTWVYRPSLANCSAPISCGDGFCQEPTETAASCPQDCESCGPFPAALEGRPSKCVNGTWLVSGDLVIEEGETLDAGSSSLMLLGNLEMRSTSTLRFAATGRSTFGSIEATGCSFLDGTLEFDVSFPIEGTAAYSFTVVSAPSGTCSSEVAERQSVGDGTAFRQIKINYQQDNECPPTSDSESSGTSFAVLIKPSSGCGGGDDTALIAGLTAGLVGGAILLVVLVIVAGIAFAYLKRQKRQKRLATMQHNLREHAGAV